MLAETFVMFEHDDDDDNEDEGEGDSEGEGEGEDEGKGEGEEEACGAVVHKGHCMCTCSARFILVQVCSSLFRMNKVLFGCSAAHSRNNAMCEGSASAAPPAHDPKWVA